MKGVFISELTYDEALKYLNEDTVMVLPLGGGSKEHGRQLPMGMDMFGCRALAQGIKVLRLIASQTAVHRKKPFPGPLQNSCLLGQY